MATTALFAEILVVGLLGLPWFGLALVSATQVRLQSLPDLHGWEPVVLAIGLAFAYALGIVIDRVGDWAFERWDEQLSQSARRAGGQGSTLPDRPEVRFRLMQSAPPMVMEFLDYARSRRRILRGVVVNCALMTLVSALALAFDRAQPSGLPLTLVYCALVTAIVFGLSALFGWWHIGAMYYRRSLVAFKLFGPNSPSP